MAQVGDRVRLTVLPPWVVQLPPESQEVFRQCVGKVFTVRDIDEHRHLELWVKNGRDWRNIARADIIFVEPEYLEVVTRKHIIGSLSTWLRQAGKLIRRAR